MDLNKSATRYDAAFDGIVGLTWLPWVGQRFAERPPHQRLLVVGQSHYHRGDTPEERQAERDGYKDRKSTRVMIAEEGWDAETMKRLPKLLFKTTVANRSELWAELWADTAYYNFVQRLLSHHDRQQPTPDDYVAGWTVFPQIVRILQPSHCLFIGVSAAKYFDHSMASQNLPFDKLSWAPEIDGVCPRVAKLNISGTPSKLIFVQHLGWCKSLSQLHDYLQTQHPDFMSCLGAQTYLSSRNA